jgi:hypothetical protein
MNDLGHVVTCHVLAPAPAAFGYLADPIRLGRWSLGCFDTSPAGPDGLYTGLSLFDGGRGFFRIESDPARGWIDYLVGDEIRQTRRIAARIMDGPGLGYASGTCLATLMAWRPSGMADDRWLRLRASHEAEIWLIKAQIEAEAAGGPRQA